MSTPFIKESSHRKGQKPGRVDRAGTSIGGAFANKLANGGCACSAGVAHGAVITADDVEAATSYTLLLDNALAGSKERVVTYDVDEEGDDFWESEDIDTNLLADEEEDPQAYRFRLTFSADPMAREGVTLIFYRIAGEDESEAVADIPSGPDNPLAVWKNVGFVIPLNGVRLETYQRISPDWRLSWNAGCKVCAALAMPGSVPVACMESLVPETYTVASVPGVLQIDISGIKHAYEVAPGNTLSVHDEEWAVALEDILALPDLVTLEYGSSHSYSSGPLVSVSTDGHTVTSTVTASIDWCATVGSFTGIVSVTMNWRYLNVYSNSYTQRFGIHLAGQPPVDPSAANVLTFIDNTEGQGAGGVTWFSVQATEFPATTLMTAAA